MLFAAALFWQSKIKATQWHKLTVIIILKKEISQTVMGRPPEIKKLRRFVNTKTGGRRAMIVKGTEQKTRSMGTAITQMSLRKEIVDRMARRREGPCQFFEKEMIKTPMVIETAAKRAFLPDRAKKPPDFSTKELKKFRPLKILS